MLKITERLWKVYYSKLHLKRKKNINQIKNILKNSKYKRIVIWRSAFGWDVTLFQRPQHIANCLADSDTLVFMSVTLIPIQM